MFAFALVALVCCYGIACNFRKNYTSEIKKLDSLTVLIDSSIMTMREVSEISTNADSALKNLKYVQENYQGTMPRSMASALNLYGMMRKDMAAVGEISQTLRIELDTARAQLVDLRQALSEGATHDRKDNKMTEDYVKASMLQEEKISNELLINVKKTADKSQSLQKFYGDFKQQMKMWMDSIPAKSVN